jgi:hypothetical protein
LPGQIDIDPSGLFVNLPIQQCHPTGVCGFAEVTDSRYPYC